MATDRFDGEFDAVLAAAQAGDPDAFERIFRAFAPSVTAYLRLQGAVEPEDLASEVFIAVLRGIDRFQGESAGFTSWVFTIARRRLVDERRRRGRQPQVDGDIATLPEALTIQAVHHDVDAAVARRLSTEWLRLVCAQLAPDQRDVLLLRLLGDLTVKEIAHLLRKTPGAIKALQRRGLAAVRRFVDHEEVPF